METTDNFSSSNEDFNDIDDPLWGNIEDCPMWGHDAMEAAPEDSDVPDFEENYFAYNG